VNLLMVFMIAFERWCIWKKEDLLDSAPHCITGVSNSIQLVQSLEAPDFKLQISTNDCSNKEPLPYETCFLLRAVSQLQDHVYFGPL
jgi:hypothetical protein